jgi:hypothetical protein
VVPQEVQHRAAAVVFLVDSPRFQRPSDQAQVRVRVPVAHPRPLPGHTIARLVVRPLAVKGEEQAGIAHPPLRLAVSKEVEVVEPLRGLVQLLQVRARDRRRGGELRRSFHILLRQVVLVQEHSFRMTLLPLVPTGEGRVIPILIAVREAVRLALYWEQPSGLVENHVLQFDLCPLKLPETNSLSDKEAQ